MMMRGLQVTAEWKPKEGYTPTAQEAAKKEAYRGDLIWYNPQMQLIEKPVPSPRMMRY